MLKSNIGLNGIRSAEIRGEKVKPIALSGAESISHNTGLLQGLRPALQPEMPVCAATICG